MPYPIDTSGLRPYNLKHGNHERLLTMPTPPRFPRRTPGFGALRAPGPGTLSNEALRDHLASIKREHFAIDADDSDDHFEASLVRQDGEPVGAYLAIDSNGDSADIVLTTRNLRALAAFLQEHFPDA